MKIKCDGQLFHEFTVVLYTAFKSENELQKTEQVTIGSGIGTCSAFFISFSLLNNVYRVSIIGQTTARVLFIQLSAASSPLLLYC